MKQQNQSTKIIERQLQEWIKHKSRPSNQIQEIKETIDKWNENPETLIQAKAIIAEKIAEKSAYDQLPVMLSLLACVLASSVSLFGDIAMGVFGLAFLIALIAIIIWTLMRKESDYYVELQILIDELSKNV